MNVETAVNVAASASRPVTEKFLTIAGAVAEPITLRVPIGVTLAECVAAAGGATTPDPHYMVGGVMMGTLQPDHEALVDKTTGGVIVLPGEHVVIRRRMQSWKQVARIGQSACDQCSYCTELCPRWLLGHPIEPHKAMRSLGFNLVGEANTMGTSFCCECNLCSLYSCPEDLDPKQVCTQNKRRLAAEKRRWEAPPLDVRRAETHLGNRKAPMARLIQKLGLREFRNVGPLRNELLAADEGRHQAQAARRRPVRPVGRRGRSRDQGAGGRPPAGRRRQAGDGRGGACVVGRHRDGRQRRRGLDSKVIGRRPHRPRLGGAMIGQLGRRLAQRLSPFFRLFRRSARGPNGGTAEKTANSDRRPACSGQSSAPLGQAQRGRDRILCFRYMGKRKDV